MKQKVVIAGAVFSLLTCSAPSVLSQKLMKASNTGGVSASQNLLTRDIRLARPVTLGQNKTTLTKTLQSLSRQTGVSLSGEDVLANETVCAWLNEVPARDVMDALAALYTTVWVRTNKGAYLLKNPIPVLKGISPQNEAQEAQFRAGLEFAQAAENLSPPLRRALADEENCTVKFTDLPPAMQNALQRITEAQMVREKVEGPTFGASGGHKAQPLPVSPSNLWQSRIRLNQDTKSGIDFYNITLAGGNGGFMVTFNNYDQRFSEQQKSASRSAAYSPAREIADEKTVAEDARLKQIVSLDIGREFLPRAVRALATQTPAVGYVTYGESGLWPPSKVALPAMPLKSLLTQLTALYPHQTWQRRKSGVIVIRYKRD